MIYHFVVFVTISGTGAEEAGRRKKLKEMEEETPEEEVDSVKDLSEVKVRLNKLEEAVKEIVVEAKKQSGGSSHAKQEDAMKKRDSIIGQAQHCRARTWKTCG